MIFWIDVADSQFWQKLSTCCAWLKTHSTSTLVIRIDRMSQAMQASVEYWDSLTHHQSRIVKPLRYERAELFR